MIITVQPKGWMDGSLILKHTKGQHALLVFDTFGGHLKAEVIAKLQKCNISHVIILGGCTSIKPPCSMKKELYREISFGICPTMMSFSSSSPGYAATAHLSCKLPSMQNRKCWLTVNDNYGVYLNAPTIFTFEEEPIL